MFLFIVHYTVNFKINFIAKFDFFKRDLLIGFQSNQQNLNEKLTFIKSAVPVK